MGRFEKEERWRREGMGYALRVAEKDGIDGLREDIRRRNITGLPCMVDQRYLDEFTQKVKDNVVNHIEILALITLVDEFGYDEDELQRFMTRFVSKAECLVDDYTTWEEQVKILADEAGVELEESMKDCTVKIKRVKN